MRDADRTGRWLGALGVVCVAVALASALVVLLDDHEPEGSWAPGGLSGLWILAVVIPLLVVAGGVLLRTGHRLRRSEPRRFLTAEDERRVLAAIRAFERRTSGEIRVHLARTAGDDILAHAETLFTSLGMTETAARNGVLFVVAVRDRRLAVVGDEGIDRCVGPAFWAEVIAHVEARFRAGAFAEGLEEGIRIAGEALATHFPPIAGDVNELPDDLSRD